MNKKGRVAGIILASVVILRVSAFAQSNLSFEVASVKQNISGQRGESLPPPKGGRFTATNVSLLHLIDYAYHVQEFQVVGADGWLNSERYDVVAKASDNAPEGQVRLMVQSLLTDRFNLKLRRDERQLPLYVLVVGKDGLKMPRATQDCTQISDPSVPCGGFRIRQRSQLTGRNVPVDELIDVLALLTGRYVANKTGLSGNFDIQLEWSPDETLALGPEPDAPAMEAGNSLFTSLQKQLGLKLESQRGPVPVLTIERAEKPKASGMHGFLY
jgi:uncharacterized protein (TIGR03435 family)